MSKRSKYSAEEKLDIKGLKESKTWKKYSKELRLLNVALIIKTINWLQKLLMFLINKFY